MIKIKIISVGKTKEEWQEKGIEEYVKRLKGFCSLDFVWLRSEDQLLGALLKERNVICLDLGGREYGSVGFADAFVEWIEKGGSEVVFAIGGADGFSEEIYTRYPKEKFLSLSKMTFTHQMTRLILVEQIYRAFTLMKGIPYHK